MVTEVGQSIPKITAVQFFDVDMQLFPCVRTYCMHLIITYLFSYFNS